MKKLLLLCFVLAFAFGAQRQGQREEMPYQTFSNDENLNPPSNPLTSQMFEARKNGDWLTYNKLLDLYKSQMPLPDNNAPVIEEARSDNNPLICWYDDKIIYAGNVAYNVWAMAMNIDDEAISVDHYVGDTLRAAAVLTDSTIWTFQSNDCGLTWFIIGGWSVSGYAIYEPEIISDPAGELYHVFGRSTTGNGDLFVITDSVNGPWSATWIESTSDTVINYSVCSDRTQYGTYYYLFCGFHKSQGGQGGDQNLFSRSFDKAASWETPVTLESGGCGNPDLAFGDNNYLYRTFIYNSSNDTNYIDVRVSADEGNNWLGTIRVQSDTMPKQGPQIAATHDGSGDAWVTWANRWVSSPYDYDLRYVWTQNYGASWSSWQGIAYSATAHEVLPSIAIHDDYYSPYISYISSDTAWYNPIVYSTTWQADSTWSAAETFNDSVPAFTRPIQTFADDYGGPALAYVGAGGVNVYYDSWSNTGIEEETAETKPGNVFMQNRPNPFHAHTLFEYNVPVSGKVSLKIFNALGQEVAKLVDEYKTAGTYTFNWTGIDKQDLTLPKGVYFAKLQVGKMNATRKIIVR